MRALVDEQLPKRLARWLDAQPGWSADHVTRLRFRGDAEIARFASKHQLLLITKDDDFPSLGLPDRFPLLWLRFGNCHNDTLLARFEDEFAPITELLASGHRLIELS